MNRTPKFLFAFLLLASFFASASFGQTTLVTGQVTDPNGIPYAFASVSAGMVNANGQTFSTPATVTLSSNTVCQAAGLGPAPCQAPFPTSQGPYTLDASGNIPLGGITLEDNSMVTPAGTLWRTCVTTGGIPPPGGTGPQTFCVNISVSGASQAIGATLSAAAPALGRGPLAGVFTSVSVQSANGVQKCERYGTPGVTSFNTLMAACLAALPAIGTGIADASNVTDATNLTMTGNFVINRNNTKFIHGNYTVSMGTNQITCPAPCINVDVEGTVPFGSDPSGTVKGAVFDYRGAAGAFLMGDATATSYNHRIADISVFINNANTSTAECFISTGVYHAVYDRVRCIGFAGANTQIGVDNKGGLTPPGSQNMLIISPYLSNTGIGFRCIGGNSPPNCNFNQIIGGEYTGPGAGIAGSICYDVENGADNWIFGLTCSNADTAIKCASISFRACLGTFHAEAIGTQGVLFATGSKNNVLETDMTCSVAQGGSGTIPCVTDIDGATVSQNILRNPSYTVGLDWVYGSLNTIGFTFLNQFNNGIRIGNTGSTGCPGLPAATATFTYLCGNFGSPILGKLYLGGNGWQFNFSKRNASADTELFQWFDTGNSKWTGSLALGGLVTPATTGLATPSITMQSLLIQNSNPSISSGFGTSPAIANSNGTASFTVNVGTGGVASSGIIGMPTANSGWTCSVSNRTAKSGNRADQTFQTSTTTTTVTVQNQTVSTGAALAWTASDILTLNCFAF
jgi:hypothetical protein